MILQPFLAEGRFAQNETFMASFQAAQSFLPCQAASRGMQFLLIPVSEIADLSFPQPMKDNIVLYSASLEEWRKCRFAEYNYNTYYWACYDNPYFTLEYLSDENEFREEEAYLESADSLWFSLVSRLMELRFSRPLERKLLARFIVHHITPDEGEVVISREDAMNLGIF